MATSFILLCFLTAAIGLALFAQGLRMASTGHRLDGRIARISAPAGAARPGLALPLLFEARGRDRQEIVQSLRQAGFEEPATLQRFLWLRMGATVAAFPIAACFCHWMWGGFFARIPLLLLAPAMTYLAAKRLLVAAGKERQRRVTAEFPFLLDLMLMMLESGVSLDQCFRAVARDEAATLPQLHRSIVALVDDLDRGMSYDHALGRWAARTSAPGSRDLAALFRQGLFQGIELSPALRQLVTEFSERRIAAAREAMGRITVQLTVVMIIFFLPAMFIVVGGPPATSLFEMIRTMRR
jgi:tight adherence protein C